MFPKRGKIKIAKFKTL